ncbi:hypothetical protein GTO89_01185 [Heliobacterium gestii]|uniref:Type I-B CRISPR-associated protein Cas8b1/Cst1 n=1 Tax=Heliomicrobium gestii TaxID=2699 RepID=A0A845LDL8_HELGE|nr:hypothetical protein [Heliomicrobium gestii]MBM7865383.1 CRISPR-associated protein Cst1 [Heliomicrobium gestii]MZP41643.1 hypothetical protein [Heliomicrobium gestii]
MERSGTVQYTGHPFVDVGVAVMEIHLEKPCEEFTKQDLKEAADWLLRNYKRADLKGYLTVHFPNSGWCNATIKGEKQAAYVQKVLHSYSADPIEPQRKCAFCDRSAQFLADRQHVPLLTGATVIVTAPGGVTGLPVCGYCLMAVQFYPLATIKVEGKPLFWWTPEPDFTHALVENLYEEVQKNLAGSVEKFESLRWPCTRLLRSAEKVLETYPKEKPLADCIGYHVTNYGSGPDYDQYYIPKELLTFWQEVKIASQPVREAHQWVVNTSWDSGKKKRAGNKREAESISQEIDKDKSGNRYYEALGQAFKSPDWHYKIPDIVSRFFFQRDPQHFHRNNYELCKRFLRKVGGMDQKRLDAIQEVADCIITHLVLGNNEMNWLKNLYRKNPGNKEFVRYLVKVQKKLSELGHAFSYQKVLDMLDIPSAEEYWHNNMWLVRDLMLIRMLEQVALQKKEMLSALEEDELDSDDQSEE